MVSCADWKKRKPTAFLGCVVGSFLKCCDLFVVFDCSSYCLRGLSPSQLFRHNCYFARRGFDILVLYRHSICGNFPSLSLSVFFLKFLLDPPFCDVFLLKSKLFSKQKKPQKISFSLNVPCLVALSPSCRLDWFHLICYIAFCHDKINGLSQV